MPDVIVNQKPSIKLKNGARIGARFGIQQQFSRHPQVNHQHAPIERDHNEFAMPVHGFYPAVADSFAQRCERLAHHVVR